VIPHAKMYLLLQHLLDEDFESVDRLGKGQGIPLGPSARNLQASYPQEACAQHSGLIVVATVFLCELLAARIMKIFCRHLSRKLV